MLRHLTLSAMMLTGILVTAAQTSMTYGSYDDNNLTCTVTGWRGDKPSGTLTVNANHKYGDKTYKVTRIAPGAFNDLPDVTEVIIGKNIKKIGDWSSTNDRGLLRNFDGMPKLKKFTVAEGNKYFTTTPGGSLLDYNDEVINYLLRVPQKCSTASGLYNIHSSVKIIYTGAFTENSTIKTIALPFALIDVEKDPGFSTMTALEAFELRDDCTDGKTSGRYRALDGVLYYDGSYNDSPRPYKEMVCFPPKKAAASFTCQTNTALILDRAVANAVNLKTIDLNRVTAVKPGAFAGSGLTELTLSNRIEARSILAATELVKDCKSLTTIAFKSKERLSIPSDFANGCTALTTVTFATAPKVIGERAFMGCSSLSTFPLDINTCLRDRAFASSGLTKVAPEGVLGDPYSAETRYTSRVFANCPALESIDFSGVTIPEGDYPDINIEFPFSVGSYKLKTVTFSPAQCYTSNAAFGFTPQLEQVIVQGDEFNNVIEVNDEVPEGYNNSCLFSADTPETFSPKLYLLTSSNPRLVHVNRMFTNINSAGKVAPSIYYQGVVPPAEPFANEETTHYIPGGTSANYKDLPGTKIEMFEFAVVKHPLTHAPVIQFGPVMPEIATMDVYFNGKRAEAQKVGGYYAPNVPYEELREVTVTYLTNKAPFGHGIEMTTTYSWDAIAGIDDITDDATLAGSGVTIDGLNVSLATSMPYTVITPQGITVASGNADSFSLDTPGIYILRLGTAPAVSTHKIALH